MDVETLLQAKKSFTVAKWMMGYFDFLEMRAKEAFIYEGHWI